jgi:hypothetical protein
MMGHGWRINTLSETSSGSPIPIIPPFRDAARTMFATNEFAAIQTWPTSAVVRSRLNPYYCRSNKALQFRPQPIYDETRGGVPRLKLPE